MKKTRIIYWIFTILLAALMLCSAIPGMMNTPESVALVVNHLHYPAYFLMLTGIAKLLGVIAILVPGFPRLKEWAYAGFTFDLIAAVYSIIAIGDPPSQWLPLIIGFILIFGSYIFYHKKLKAGLSDDAK